METRPATKRSLTSLRGNSADASGLAFGKIPPQARDLEEAVIGAILIDDKALSQVIDILKAETFYVEAHAIIFRAISQLFEKTQPIDILTVAQQLRQNGQLEMIGGAYYLSELTNKVASSANIEYHARIVIQKFIQRRLIEVSTDIIKEAYEDTTDVLDLLDKSEQNIFAVAEQNLRRGSSGMSNILADALREMDEARNTKEGLTGVPSGYKDLDRITNGWQKSDLIIVAARPAMGKTAFILNMARTAAVDHKKAVAIFSLEMSATQLVKRIISAHCELDSKKIQKGDFTDAEWARMSKELDSLSKAPIYINDTAAINIFEFRAQCRRLKSAHNIELVMIDYLQLMSGVSDNMKGGNREQEISNISRSLKSIAKELEIPVIALSQLSRAVETRAGDKRPQLSDLRESGAIEQDADMVMALYRPEYYNFTEDSAGNSTQGLAEVILLKNRHGGTEDIKLKFKGEYAKFEDIQEYNYNQYSSKGNSDSFEQENNYKTVQSKINDSENDAF